MCGAVTFVARDVPDRFGACHCEMCRRWAGSALMAATVPLGDVSFTGESAIKRVQSSEWAERAWCGKCGTGLWYRVTAEGPMGGNYELPVGLFDSTEGMTLDSEIFYDVKSHAVNLSGETKKMTRAEVFAKYAPDQLDEGESA